MDVEFLLADVGVAGFALGVGVEEFDLEAPAGLPDGVVVHRSRLRQSVVRPPVVRPPPVRSADGVRVPSAVLAPTDRPIITIVVIQQV